jgi:hypothetical protein
MRKKPAFIIAAVILGAGAVELVSFIVFTAFGDRFTFCDPGRFALTAADDLDAMRRRFDERLGWDNHYDTPLAERPRPVSYGRPLIACFGDSYTHCDEVGDDETWQTYLAGLLEADVYNFGTPGYGTDQAYLKYLGMRGHLRTPVVALGLISEIPCEARTSCPVSATGGSYVGSASTTIGTTGISIRCDPFPTRGFCSTDGSGSRRTTES